MAGNLIAVGLLGPATLFIVLLLVLPRRWSTALAAMLMVVTLGSFLGFAVLAPVDSFGLSR